MGQNDGDWAGRPCGAYDFFVAAANKRQICILKAIAMGYITLDEFIKMAVPKAMEELAAKVSQEKHGSIEDERYMISGTRKPRYTLRARADACLGCDYSTRPECGTTVSCRTMPLTRESALSAVRAYACR